MTKFIDAGDLPTPTVERVPVHVSAMSPAYAVPQSIEKLTSQVESFSIADTPPPLITKKLSHTFCAAAVTVASAQGPRFQIDPQPVGRLTQQSYG